MIDAEHKQGFFNSTLTEPQAAVIREQDSDFWFTAGGGQPTTQEIAAQREKSLLRYQQQKKNNSNLPSILPESVVFGSHSLRMLAKAETTTLIVPDELDNEIRKKVNGRKIVAFDDASAERPGYPIFLFVQNSDQSPLECVKIYPGEEADEETRKAIPPENFTEDIPQNEEPLSETITLKERDVDLILSHSPNFFDTFGRRPNALQFSSETNQDFLARNFTFVRLLLLPAGSSSGQVEQKRIQNLLYGRSFQQDFRDWLMKTSTVTSDVDGFTQEMHKMFERVLGSSDLVAIDMQWSRGVDPTRFQLFYRQGEELRYAELQYIHDQRRWEVVGEGKEESVADEQTSTVESVVPTEGGSSSPDPKVTESDLADYYQDGKRLGEVDKGSEVSNEAPEISEIDRHRQMLKERLQSFFERRDKSRRGISLARINDSNFLDQLVGEGLSTEQAVKVQKLLSKMGSN